MLQDEAEEVSDGELSTSSNDDERPWLRGAKMQPGDHKHRRVFAFVADAMAMASEKEWDDAEMAKLAVLCIQTLNLKHGAAWSFLNKHCADMATPTFLSKLKDEGLRTTAQNVFTILQMSRCSRDELISKLSECLEEHVLSLHDDDALDLLVSVGEGTMTEEKRVQYIARLCEHCNAKKTAGKVMNAFVKSLPLEEATSLVHEVAELDFFLDLRGSMKAFYKQFGDRRREIEERLESVAQQQALTLSASEDEDQDGNLRGFVVDDEDPVIDDSSGPDEPPLEDRKRLKKRKKESKKNKKRKNSKETAPAAVRKRRVIAPDEDDSDT